MIFIPYTVSPFRRAFRGIAKQRFPPTERGCSPRSHLYCSTLFVICKQFFRNFTSDFIEYVQTVKILALSCRITKKLLTTHPTYDKIGLVGTRAYSSHFCLFCIKGKNEPENTSCALGRFLCGCFSVSFFIFDLVKLIIKPFLRSPHNKVDC